MKERTGTKKRTGAKESQLLKTIDGVDNSKVVEVADFGHFNIVLLKDGAIFHTYIGYEVRCKAWCLDYDGKAQETNLYAWLRNLCEMQKMAKDHAQELFPETDVTYQDMLDSMIVTTEANMTHPITAFVDMNAATKFATERLQFLKEMTEKLSAAMSAEVKDETADDLKMNFEHGEQAVLAETASEMLKDADNDNTNTTQTKEKEEG